MTQVDRLRTSSRLPPSLQLSGELSQSSQSWWQHNQHWHWHHWAARAQTIPRHSVTPEAALAARSAADRLQSGRADVQGQQHVDTVVPSTPDQRQKSTENTGQSHNSPTPQSGHHTTGCIRSSLSQFTNTSDWADNTNHRTDLFVSSIVALYQDGRLYLSQLLSGLLLLLVLVTSIETLNYLRRLV